MRIFLSLTALLLFNVSLIAQSSSSIRGTIYDTAGRQSVVNATVTLVKSKDSSLVSFTMTGGDGRFNFSGLAAGDFHLLVTHVSFHSTAMNVKLDGHQSVALDTIILTDKAKVMAGVTVVSDAPPVTLIDDTVQYNAGSFKTQPNATVEDLLKKLPGIKVAKDGSIKAQGDKVQKVLVDGKEFFGD
ncbi:MAG TPA: carboxypeptidase-like regulatory domain-containing protein, partial [Chitinophagaceae bacterium]